MTASENNALLSTVDHFGVNVAVGGGGVVATEGVTGVEEGTLGRSAAGAVAAGLVVVVPRVSGLVTGAAVDEEC